MNKSKITAILVAASLLAASSLLAQRKSPHETVGAVIDRNRVTIVYGRPYTKDPKSGEPRKIWGALVPYDKIWRTGADEATLLITQKPIDFSGTTVPAGAYALWPVPAGNGGHRILSKAIGGWGTQPPKPDDELARVDLKKEPLDQPLDQFNIIVAKNPDGGGLIKLQWENAQYIAPFTVVK